MRNASCYGGRRIHLQIDGLPGWLMSILADAGPFKWEAVGYSGAVDGPTSLLLGSTLVVSTTEPAPVVIEKADPEEPEEPRPSEP